MAFVGVPVPCLYIGLYINAFTPFPYDEDILDNEMVE